MKKRILSLALVLCFGLTPVPSALAQGDTFSSISAGVHSLVIKNDGSLWEWGFIEYAVHDPKSIY